MKRPRPMSRSTLLLATVMAITWALGAAQEEAAAVEGEKKVFVATKDWQPIPEGYSIPQGLHVRMDLSTGGKFAKLLDRDEPSSGNAVTISHNATATAKKVVPEGMDEEVEPEVVQASVKDDVDASLRTMEKVLHNLPQGERDKMGIDLEQARQAMSEAEYWQHVRGLWDDRQAIIKQVYEQMIKTDELLTTLINTLSEAHTRTHHEVNGALLQLEDHVGDIDMARDFKTLGGWPHLLHLLHHTHHESVRANAAWVLGNAVKNDPTFQQWALDVVELQVEVEGGGATSALSRLVSLLEIEDSNKAAPAALLEGRERDLLEGKEEGDMRKKVDERRRRALYAITSASRNNRMVRSELLRLDGLSKMAGLLSCPHASTSLKVKAATFVHDLLSEEEAHAANGGAHQGEEGEGAHHSLVVLEESIRQAEQAWCRGLQSLVVEAREDPRLLERAVEAAGSMVRGGHCPIGMFDEAAREVRRAWGRERDGVEEEYRRELLAGIDRLGGGERGREREEL